MFARLKSLTTEAVVGASALTGLIVYAWLFLPWPWAIVATCAAGWEAWSLIDGTPANTISEIIWRASDRYSLVPWAGGFIFGLGIGSEYIVTAEVIAPLALLCGHFWFPKYDSAARKIVDKFEK
jgi:hypothetical protein